MTLITHFRNSKYAVIAGDGFEKSWDESDDLLITSEKYDRKKIQKISNDILIGGYGHIASETDEFVRNWDGQLCHLEEHIIKEYSSNTGWLAGVGFIIVSPNSTQFLWKHLKRKEPAQFENINEKNLNFLSPSTKDPVLAYKQLCGNEIFFGIDYGNEIDWEHQKRLLFAFYQAFGKYFKSSTFDLELFESKEIIEKFIKILYRDIIYKCDELNSNASIYGDIQLGLINLLKNETTLETIYQCEKKPIVCESAKPKPSDEVFDFPNFSEEFEKENPII
jgi:hypothetical protein